MVGGSRLTSWIVGPRRGSIPAAGMPGGEVLKKAIKVRRQMDRELGPGVEGGTRGGGRAGGRGGERERK